MSRDRYSVENVFRVNSMANIFYALVRDFKKTQMSDPGCHGLFTTEEDFDIVYQYIEMLCEQMRAIVRTEPKVIQLAGPIYIIGDLQGSLLDLMAYENRFFRSTPAISPTVLFLGNYSGPEFPYGIECITSGVRWNKLAVASAKNVFR